MKKLFKRTLVLASLSLLSGVAAAQIATTPHNLSTSGTGPNHTNGVTALSGTDQICVFCHTPHGSNVDVAAPLWNRTSTTSTYTLYTTANSSSIDGGVLPVGGVSLACLSCHDGTQAMNTMVNAPGSGNPSTAGYTWDGSSTITGIANLGTNLQNDHPIGIEYCGGGITAATATTIGGTCADTDFIGPGGEQDTRLQTASINSTQVFWVDVGGTGLGTRSSSDIILFTRDFTTVGGAAASPSVECASCHDPHTAATGLDVNFMRVTTAGSTICLACHVK